MIYERPSGAGLGEAIRSRFYSNTGDILTIWAGEPLSPADYRGTFSANDDTLIGAWHYPGGGGYEVVSTRVE